MSEGPAGNLEDIEQLFRENDNIGADSSLWLRAARQLLQHGKPVGQLTVLAFKSADGRSLPFGALTHTTRNRSLFWPVLPRNAQTVAKQGAIDVIDHVTLELPSEKVHATAYDGTGMSVHHSAADLGHTRAWRLQRFEGRNLALWFTMLVRWDVLEEQDFAVQRLVRMRTTDAERRKQEFARLAGQIKVMNVPLPATASDPSYVYCLAYFVTGPATDVEFPPEALATAGLDEHIDGFPDGTIFPVRPLKLLYERTQFIFAAACPPGTLKHDVIVGFPRAR